MAVTKSQWYEWKQHPVTQELMHELQTNMEEYIARMVRRTADDYEDDQRIRAYVRVATDVLQFSPEIHQEEEAQDA